jgi:hypothetical protein
MSSPDLPDFPTFEAAAKARGFDEVLERKWAPGHETGKHRHPFVAHALVVQGDFRLTVGGDCRHLYAGDTFDLDRDVERSENYGPQGATYWVARRN